MTSPSLQLFILKYMDYINQAYMGLLHVTCVSTMVIMVDSNPVQLPVSYTHMYTIHVLSLCMQAVHNDMWWVFVMKLMSSARYNLIV